MVTINGNELSGVAYLEWLKDNFPPDNISLLKDDLSLEPKEEADITDIVFGSFDSYGPQACICGTGLANKYHSAWCPVAKQVGE